MSVARSMNIGSKMLKLYHFCVMQKGKTPVCSEAWVVSVLECCHTEFYYVVSNLEDR